MGIKVVGASVDSLERATELKEGLRLGFVQMGYGIDGPAVAEQTGAFIQTGDRTFLHATGFLLRPDGSVAQSVFSTGPIGRFTANDVMKKVRFEVGR